MTIFTLDCADPWYPPPNGKGPRTDEAYAITDMSSKLAMVIATFNHKKLHLPTGTTPKDVWIRFRKRHAFDQCSPDIRIDCWLPDVGLKPKQKRDVRDALQGIFAEEFRERYVTPSWRLEISFGNTVGCSVDQDGTVVSW
jgi:hypothetical protein